MAEFRVTLRCQALCSGVLPPSASSVLTAKDSNNIWTALAAKCAGSYCAVLRNVFLFNSNEVM